MLPSVHSVDLDAVCTSGGCREDKGGGGLQGADMAGRGAPLMAGVVEKVQGQGQAGTGG